MIYRCRVWPHKNIRISKREWELVKSGVEAFSTWRYANGRLVSLTECRNEFEKQNYQKKRKVHRWLGVVFRQECRARRLENCVKRGKQKAIERAYGEFTQAWMLNRQLIGELRKYESI